MAVFVWSATSEVQEAANATRWAEAHHATLVTGSSIRQQGCLAAMAANDTLVIVAHGEPGSIGTRGDAVSFDAVQLAAKLVDVLGIPDNVRVVLAACSSDTFATAAQTAIRAHPHHDAVTCVGQQGDFSFGANFAIP